MPEPAGVFLDANVLFSASYQPNHVFVSLWAESGLIIMTSPYTAGEARRNCSNEAHSKRLDALLERTKIVPDSGVNILPADIDLPEKDRPVLAAAIHAHAAYFITGDMRHFSRWMQSPIPTSYGIIAVMQPRQFLERLL